MNYDCTLIPAESLCEFLTAQNDLMAYSTFQTSKCEGFANRGLCIASVVRRIPGDSPPIEGNILSEDIKAIRNLP